jgi:hypothetical protein
LLQLSRVLTVDRGVEGLVGQKKPGKLHIRIPHPLCGTVRAASPLLRDGKMELPHDVEFEIFFAAIRHRVAGDE